jgi:hypothetical protein
LSEEILADIELSRTPAASFPRKVARLARLLEDHDLMRLLRFEVSGYLLQADGTWGAEEWEACLYFNRGFYRPDGSLAAYGSTLGQIEVEVQTATARLAVTADPSVSISSANPAQLIAGPVANATERQAVSTHIGTLTSLRDRVAGRLHQYVTERNYELRFGSAVESAFEVVRGRVDGSISAVVPEAVQMLAGAFEANASSNPEQWAHAASTCRRLLVAVADALRPAGPDVDGRKMSQGAYVNRLVDWISGRMQSETLLDVISSDLRHLGERLDAIDEAGHKGAHDRVSQLDASRFIVGTYLLLGDILALRGEVRGEAGPAPVVPDPGASYPKGDLG